MHLDTKSFVLLVSPFVVASGVWLFSDSLITSLEHFFEPARQQPTKILQEKGERYRYLTEHRNEYASLLKQIQIRNENRFWISERLFVPFAEPRSSSSSVPSESSLPLLPPPLLPASGGDFKAPAAMKWSVQMILPEQQTAIVNNQIMHVGESINGVKLLQVKKDSVSIQTDKGIQWIKLFH